MDAQTTIDDIDPRTKARHDDPDTSHAAAHSNPPLKRTQRNRVLAVHQANPSGLTDDECSAFLPDMRLNSLTTRRSELVKLGFLRDSGERRRTSAGIQAVVWKLV